MLYRCSIAGTRDKENFIQFVASHDFTYWLYQRHDVTAAMSLIAIGTA